MPRNAATGVIGKAAAGGELAAAFLVGALLIVFGAAQLAATFPPIGRVAGGLAERQPAALKAKGRQEAKLAFASDPSSERAASLRASAREALRSGLAQAPADPGAWFDLARLEKAENRPTPAMARALRLSIMTGPREPELVLSRLELGLADWAVFEPDDRLLLMEQVRLAWSDYPRGLALVGRRLDVADLVRAALGEVPGAAEDFSKLLAEIDPNAIRS